MQTLPAGYCDRWQERDHLCKLHHPWTFPADFASARSDGVHAIGCVCEECCLARVRDESGI